MTKEQLIQLEADLWTAADNLRASSDLKAFKYSIPVLGRIFLKFAKLFISILETIQNLLNQNSNLTQTHDTLLPRLIFDKLSVDTLDIQFPPRIRESESLNPDES